MSDSEYKAYTLRNDMSSISKQKCKAQANFEDKFNLADMSFKLGPAEKVFGPGGTAKTKGQQNLFLVSLPIE